jgi:hypothetical protein
VPTTHSDVGAAAEDHTHNYAGSSSAGGAATSANKLNTDAGSETQPVYFSNGVPVNCTYTLGATVPSNAEFTDTKVASSVSTSKAYLLGSTSSTDTTGTTVKNTSVYMSAGKLYVDDSEVASQATINNTVSGLTTVCNSLNSRVSYLEDFPHDEYLTSHQTIYNLTLSAGAFTAGTFEPNSADKTIYIPTHTSHITNNSGYITSGATVAASNKLANAKTLWGQSFNGESNVSGAISNTGNITPSANATHELGTSSLKYKNVNVSNNVNIGESNISYNATTGCLEIIC